MSAMTITDFITARLDEWGRIARAASPGPWLLKFGPESPPLLVDCNGSVLLEVGRHLIVRWEDIAHIVAHNPAQTLALVAGLRTVVETHAATSPPDFTVGCCRICDTLTYPCPTIKAIAAIWADHPRYLDWE